MSPLQLNQLKRCYDNLFLIIFVSSYLFFSIRPKPALEPRSHGTTRSIPWWPSFGCNIPQIVPSGFVHRSLGRKKHNKMWDLWGEVAEGHFSVAVFLMLLSRCPPFFAIKTNSEGWKPSCHVTGFKHADILRGFLIAWRLVGFVLH